MGTQKKGKLKVKDGDTGRESWRQVKSGVLKDIDGEPTSKRYNYSQMKKKPMHRTHVGHNKKTKAQREASNRQRDE